jgi:hypothetical protein
MSDNRVLTTLRQLAKRGAALAPAGRAAVDGTSIAAYRIVSSGEAASRGGEIPADEVRRWLSDDLIAPVGDGFRISASGIAWLKRRLSSPQDFQAQHQQRTTRIIDVEGAKRPAIVNEAESPLAWLASRKDKNGAPLLTAFQLRAGERLRADYEFAGLTARVTASWSPVASGGSGSNSQNDAAALQDHILAARQRVVRAVAAVGPELCGILIDVCCHLKGIEEAEKAEGLPQRSGKVVLQIALTRLARHYGLVSDAELTARVQRKLVHWGTEDYRPKMGAGDPAS